MLCLFSILTIIILLYCCFNALYCAHHLHDLFMHQSKTSSSYLFGPERFKKSISGPSLKKVVHHCHKVCLQRGGGEFFKCGHLRTEGRGKVKDQWVMPKYKIAYTVSCYSSCAVQFVKKNIILDCTTRPT